MVKSPSLGSEALKSTAGKILMAIARFGGAVLFARLLDPHTFGAAYVLFRFGNILSQVVLGWADAAKKRIASGSEEGQIIGVLTVVVIGWTSLIFLILMIGGNIVGTETGIPNAALLLALVVISEAIGHVTEKILEGRGKIGTASFTRAGRFIFALPLQAGLLLLGYGVGGFIGGLLMATVLIGSVVIVIYRLTPAIPSTKEIKEQWAFAKFSVPNAVIGTSYGSLDMLLLAFLLTSAASGYYEAAWTLTMPAVFIASSLGNTLMTKMSSQKKHRDSIKPLRRSLQYSSVAAIPIFSGALVIGDSLIQLVFGNQYTAAIPLLIGLSLFQLIRTQVIPLLQAAYGLGHPEVVFRVSVIAVILNLIIGVLLVRFFGAIGVVIATIVAESVRYGSLLSFISSKSGRILMVGREHMIQIFSAIVMAITIHICDEIIVLESDIVKYGSTIVVGGLVYIGLILLLDRQLSGIVRNKIA